MLDTADFLLEMLRHNHNHTRLLSIGLLLVFQSSQAHTRTKRTREWSRLGPPRHLRTQTTRRKREENPERTVVVVVVVAQVVVVVVENVR